MADIDLTPAVHRAHAVELIAKAPTIILDDIVVAVCARILEVDESERGHPTQIDRAVRVLRAFGRSVHLAPLVYDALSGPQLRALLVLALDRFAVDATDADARAVAAAAERFVRALREPAVVDVVIRPARGLGARPCNAPRTAATEE